MAIFAVELERADMSAAEQEQVNQVLALPGTERATDILLASEGLISLTNEFIPALCHVLSMWLMLTFIIVSCFVK